MLAQERRQDLVFPHPPPFRIFAGRKRSFRTAPKLFPCVAARVYPKRCISTRPSPLEPLQEVMLDETGEIEEAAPLRITDSAFKGRSIRITGE